MNQNTVWVPFNIMQDFMTNVFKGVGVPEEDAKICADVLITADKLGIDSHGISRLKTIYYDRIKDKIQNPITNIEILRDGPTTAVIDGHNGMGHVISHQAMEMAINKAKNYGLGMTVVRNSNHYGIAGYYLLMAIKEGMIGISGTNARPSIAPTFGVENMLGTNPLSFGMPTDEPFPFLLDCATSISQRGKIEVYKRYNQDVPSGWVIDHEGNSLTDSDQILKDLITGNAALTPLGGMGEDFGGYKGYGYATVVEILSASLQGGAFLKALTGYDENGNKQPYKLGHFFIAINIESFTKLSEFKKTTGDILRALRNSKKAPGHDRIYTAGEKEYLTWLDRKDKGVPVNESLQKEILQMKKELDLIQYQFPFE
ncbi:MAG: Ldh family oxidoreductase [Syntrophomonadaceae bacterium]|nr:Ldh family oxidoreductase [Syntrophomonadaceae bacterium]